MDLELQQKLDLMHSEQREFQTIVLTALRDMNQIPLVPGTSWSDTCSWQYRLNSDIYSFLLNK